MIKKKHLLSFSKKNLIVIVDYLFNQRVIFSMIGLMNKTILRGIIKSVFLAYPAKKRHIESYTYPWFSKRIKWKPAIIGIFIQKGKIGIAFAISSMESDFVDDENRDSLKKVASFIEERRKLLGADQKSFAGILPGVLSKKAILKKTEEADLTVRAIFMAIEALKEKKAMSSTFSIIVLGGKGFIGGKLTSFLKRSEEYKNRVFSLDLDDFNKMPEVMARIKDKDVMFLNITKKKALNDYMPFFSKKTVILNEVYPEPSEHDLSKIKERGASCYHIVGLKGKMYPPLPGAYREGVPCCASFVSCEKNDILIKELI